MKPRRPVGHVHAEKKLGQYIFARITESGTGAELWRCRGPNEFELDRKASVFTSLDHFIATMRHVLGEQEIPQEAIHDEREKKATLLDDDGAEDHPGLLSDGRDISF